MKVKKSIVLVALLSSSSVKAELVETDPGVSWLFTGHFSTVPERYAACLSVAAEFGQSKGVCQWSEPIPPGTYSHLSGGHYWDPKAPKNAPRSLFFDAWSCENSDEVRYFPASKKCEVIFKQTKPLPANPKANGPSCPPNRQNRQPSCGNPIAIGTGSKVQQERDYAALAVGLPLESTRTYNGGVFAGDMLASGVFGSRWTHALDRKIEIRSTQAALACFRRRDNQHLFCSESLAQGAGGAPSALVTRPDGKIYQFNRLNNQWTAEADVDDRLTAEYGADGITPASWTYLTADGDTEQYNADGKILKATTRAGITQRFTYSSGLSNDTSASRVPEDAPACSNIQSGAALPAGLAVCVTDHWGRQLQFEYDSKKRVSKLIDPANQQYLYEYDGPSGGCVTSSPVNPACSSNNLTAVTYPGGKKRIYHYNEAAWINNNVACAYSPKVTEGFAHLVTALTGITDENGIRFASWGWDCYNQAISSQHAGGVDKITLVYGARANDGSNSVAVTSHMGTASAPQTITRNYRFKINLGVAKNEAIDQPCAGCDGMKARTYDTNGNVLTSEDWSGKKTSYTYNLERNLEISRTEAVGTTVARTITTEWHPTMRLATKVAEPLRITSYTHDEYGNMLSESIQATNDANGSKAFIATPQGNPKSWSFGYNASGQLISKTGPGVRLALTYDEQGNLSTVRNAANHETRYSNYDVNGRVGQITDPNGLTTSFQYGPRGWLDSVSVGGEVTSYEYDGVGNLKLSTMPDGSIIQYDYDNARRLTAITDSLGNKITYTVDLTGNRIAEATEDASGILARKIGRVFDTFNRLKQVTGAAQ